MNKKESRDFFQSLEDDHREILQKIEALYERVNHLRYEGKAALGRNLREARRMLKDFSRSLSASIAMEEEVLFRYLATHVPKVEAFLPLFRSEHSDFQNQVERFELILEKIGKEKDPLAQGKCIDELKETSAYLLYLSKQHIHAEQEGLYRVIAHDLRSNEKKELEAQLTSHWRTHSQAS